MAAKTTTHPPVNKELRPIVAWLRDRDGCSFEVHSGHLVVLRADGKPARTESGQPVRISARGKANDVNALRHSVSQLQGAGLLRGYAGGRSRPKQAPAAAAAPVPAAPAPAAPAPATSKEAPVAAPPPVPVRPVARPTRAHTAHQARLDSVRGRIYRVLADLGGNTAEARKLFIEHCVEVATAHGLPLPISGKLGGSSTVYQSLRSSLGKYLQGGGQTQRNLDIWELGVQALERPVPQPAPPLAVAAEQVGVPVQLPPVRIEGGRSGRAGVGVQVVQEQAEDGHLQQAVTGKPQPPAEDLLRRIGQADDKRVQRARDAAWAGSEALAREARRLGYDCTCGRGSVPHMPACELAQLAGVPLADVAADDPVRQAAADKYIDLLMGKAAEGDTDARDRLERYLQLG